MTFAGQVALVTGGARGIGKAIAAQLAASGATVVLADLDGDAVEIAAREVGASDGIAVDVSNSSAVDAMVERMVAGHGKIDILVHSAGIGLERSFLETSDEEWHRLIEVDLSGTFYTMRAVGQVMATAGYGRIVTLASTAGERGGTGRAAYGAAKGGVIMLTRVLAVELAESGVTVNTLAPGAIETELVQRMHSDATRVNYRRSIPADRYGTPEEVAEAALFLVSKGASYVTGHVLAVDGGFLAAGVLNRAGWDQ
ncbi:MAG: SDR family NAD(P)-dependent oxidoreductase [Erythrobacter sp.]|uniref:SDR family NAD(P)-dependent oxidoreductase n=1 Tax=Erythrobacter sp. TaxID=1042 RepID=UPI002609D430|nr:SDR family NAD(P)-dependent oxidoreductase [Erythrobacter sp.]MDJ0978170.1 SDR family NAD(P)-dependent oxidoreductase [Erythrobacter sp.]